MKENKFEFNYKVFDSVDELPEDQRKLLKEARPTAHVVASQLKVCPGEVVDFTATGGATGAGTGAGSADRAGGRGGGGAWGKGYE